MANHFLLPFALALAGLTPARTQDMPGEADTRDLLALLKTPVVSASKSSEKLSDAPATVIVISRSDLDDRGYTELSQILDDLPGMDLARSYGADYFKNYWRGYRNDIGEPFLVLVDGIEFNHLWYNTADTPLVTYPLSAVERVEVVYGPASSVYGANAFMGVINIIARKVAPEGAFTARGKLTSGSFESRIADLFLSKGVGNAVFTLAARSDKGEMDESAAERYEYTKAKHYADAVLWGPNVVSHATEGGSASSPHQHSALDARLTWGATEFGYQQLIISSGYGTAYAADQSQSAGLWVRPDYSLFMRHREELTDRITSSTMIRYRRSDLDSSSYDLESAYAWGYPNGQTRFTFYEVLNASLTFSQDLEYKASKALTLNAGLRFEDKTLQKAYLQPWTIIDATHGDLPARPNGGLDDTNHFNVENRGIYVQGRYHFLGNQQVNLGLRDDHNSIYGTANTFRGGYVGTFGSWGVKALFGQAYQEPTGRLLFGATSGTGSNSNLRPERSSTAELSGSFTAPAFSLTLGVYRVRNTGKIQTINDEVVNSGDQEVLGADLGCQWLLPVSSLRQWKIWGYYSRYFKAEDIAFSPSGEVRTRSGDLSDNKFWLGTTVLVNARVSATLLGRFIGTRPTVLSNPVREVPDYGSLDLSLNAKDFWLKGMGVSLRAANLLDKAYFQPGLRSASAGTAPGGSKGYYNSLLPQPGRSVQFSVTFEF
ncbi:MAG TPA: TonB-dependent receptor [Geothrix sp.]|nr:TonB-dependent receptor [Geothrix sp.]